MCASSPKSDQFSRIDSWKNEKLPYKYKTIILSKNSFYYFRQFRESNLIPATWISNENNDWFAKGKYVSKYVLFRSAVKRTSSFTIIGLQKSLLQKKKKNLLFYFAATKLILSLLWCIWKADDQLSMNKPLDFSPAFN